MLMENGRQARPSHVRGELPPQLTSDDHFDWTSDIYSPRVRSLHRSIMFMSCMPAPIPPAGSRSRPRHVRGWLRRRSPLTVTARRHKCCSICYSHHRDRLPVDLHRCSRAVQGRHASSSQRPAPVPHRAALAARGSPHHPSRTVRSMRRARRLQRPPAAPCGELGHSPSQSPHS